MATASRLSRPLQRRCAACRRGQEVRLAALYHIVVPNKGGGTRRDGGFDCRYCGHENPIPAAELPQGLLPSLPDHDSQRRAAAAAKAPPPAAVAAAPASSAPVAAAKPVVRKLPPPPKWVAGGQATQLLLTAYRKSLEDSAALRTAFVRSGTGSLATTELPAGLAEPAILDWLDRTGCELLVIAGTDADQARWKAVFHPLAGAATLATEPG